MIFGELSGLIDVLELKRLLLAWKQTHGDICTDPVILSDC